MMAINVRFRTNLDLEPCDKSGFPTKLPEVPRIGDHVESSHRWVQPGGIDCHLRLKVVAVTWKWGGWEETPIEGGDKIGQYLGPPNDESDYYPEIELHTRSPFQNLVEFYEWYGRITGRGKSAYI